MAENHIIEVRYSAAGYTKTRPIYQYDYGMELHLVDFPNLPGTFEMHFSTGRGEAVTQIGTNGVVAVPDSCLTRFGTLAAWLFLHDGEDDGETTYTIDTPVRSKGKATDTQPEPEEQSVITQAMAALNNAVETTGAAQEATEEARDQAVEAATAAGSSETAAGESATSANQSRAEADKARALAEVASTKNSSSYVKSNGETEYVASGVVSIRDSTGTRVSVPNNAVGWREEAYKEAVRAAGSATAAANSATDAAASRTAADQSATAAGTSETNAGRSATAAAQSATSAGQSAETATNAATAAAASQTAAEAAAGTATGAASTATTAAGTAQTAAGTATEKAGEASASATAAAGSATEAATVVQEVEDDLDSLKSAIDSADILNLLHSEEINDTVQTIAFDASGNVQSITHTKEGTTVRTDAFTFGANTITEVRTLATGQRLTIVTNTTTLTTTVTYADAA